MLHVDSPRSGATRVHITKITLLNRVFLSRICYLGIGQTEGLCSFHRYVIVFSHLLSLVVHGIGTKLVSNWKQNMLYQKLTNFTYKNNIYVNRLQSVILACKCVIHRPEHGGHYSWKLLEYNLTPGKIPEKMKNSWIFLEKGSWIYVLPKCFSFINAKLPHSGINS